LVVQPVACRYTADFTDTNPAAKQGRSLCPIRFNVYMGATLIEWKNEIHEIGMQQRGIMNTVLFPDDEVLITTSEEYIQATIHRLRLIMS
jgi:hypothetical protein